MSFAWSWLQLHLLPVTVVTIVTIAPDNDRMLLHNNYIHLDCIIGNITNNVLLYNDHPE